MAYIFAALIGISLGVLGGGGSILTVPVLVYLLGFEAKLSIALSLAIVGLTSLVGVGSHFKKGNVDLKIALVFGPVAMVGTFAGAKLSVFFSGTLQLLFFAVIMLLAAVMMLRKSSSSSSQATPETTAPAKKSRHFLIALEGLFVGLVTGIVGVGGGFMIVPALVLFGGLEMRRAVGTSLLIIAAKSFAGFAGYFGQVEIPWSFLLQFSAVSSLGIFVGTALSQRLPQNTLRKIFAIFLILMSLFILYKNIALVSV
jgi:hypothetical protein